MLFVNTVVVEDMTFYKNDKDRNTIKELTLVYRYHPNSRHHESKRSEEGGFPTQCSNLTCMGEGLCKIP